MSLTKVSYSMIQGAPISVLDYGATGNGTTDDTAAINAAVSALTSNGTLIFPPGNYKYNSGTNGIQIVGLTNVSISGQGAVITCAVNARFMYIYNSTCVKVSGFTIQGSLSNSQRFIGNEEQGRILTQSSSEVDIFQNTWRSTAAALFLQANSDKINFHHNDVLLTHAGVQTSSAAYSNFLVTDNFFLGHVYQTVDVGSDDQIAVFGTSSGRVVISNNIIDKQGPTAYNQAHGILISLDTNGVTDSEIIVSNNVVRNVITTRTAGCSAAIEVNGRSLGNTTNEVIVTNNTITNSNFGITINPYTTKVIASTNIIYNVVALSGVSNTGCGILTTAGVGTFYMVLSGNVINQCDSAGINAYGLNNIIISSNEIALCTSRGIALDTGANGVISDNLVTSCGTGLLVNNFQSISVTGNSINSNTLGVQISGATVSGSMVGNSLVGNTTAYTNTASTSTILVQINNGINLPFAPLQASSAPTYGKGLMYFDTTLNKLRIGGATAWETVTSV